MSPTPAGVIVNATAPDGTTTDVTECVQALYDLVIQSMDWGSGFLTKEDAIPVAKIARICGFEGSEEAERYIHSFEEADERKKQALAKAEEAKRIIEMYRKKGIDLT